MAWGQTVLQSEEYLQLPSYYVDGGAIDNAEIVDQAGGMNGRELVQPQCG